VLDGISLLALERKYDLAEVSFFSSRQRGKFKENSVKQGND